VEVGNSDDVDALIVGAVEDAEWEPRHQDAAEPVAKGTPALWEFEQALTGVLD
jgi:hypothetical protein